MIYWIVSLALAALVGGLLARAMLRRDPMEQEAEADLAVYRDQLKEVDRDLSRGVVSESEAEQVRLEVSRRLLDADKAAQARHVQSAPPGSTRIAAGLVVLIVVAGSGLLYFRQGAPWYPDLPMDTRLAQADEARENRMSQAEAEASLPPAPTMNAEPDYLDLVERLRNAVADRPDDLQGHEMLVRHESNLGNFAAAHAAQSRVIEIKGEAATARDFAQLSDLLVLAARGYVSPEAEAAIAATMAKEPNNGTARYYSGLLAAQTGRPDIAFRIWRNLLEGSDPGAPWVPPIRAQIEALARQAGTTYALPDIRGPSAADVEAAGDMSDEDRAAMIENMVEGLAERLANEGGPPQDWARLIRALGVLGQADRAAAIWSEAQTVFVDDAALSPIRDAARSAGVAE